MKKILKSLLCVALIVVFVGRVFLGPNARREYPFEFLLKTSRQPEGDYLKLILPLRNFSRIKMATLITPRQEKVNLKRNDFKINKHRNIMISNRIMVNEITAGLYWLEVSFQNNSNWTGSLHFIPSYIQFPGNVSIIADSLVSWDYDAKIAAFKVEVIDTNGHVAWESKSNEQDFTDRLYIDFNVVMNSLRVKRARFRYCIDGSRLREGNEYGLRIKSYDKEEFPMPRGEQIDFANENISETKKFFYHKSAPQLLLWQIHNTAFEEDTQRIYMVKVRITNLWAIKKIICIDSQGKSYRLKKKGTWHIGYLTEQEDGIFTLKIYRFGQEPLIIRKQFLFSKEHAFPSNIHYANKKISWDIKEEVDLYQVRIYREDKKGYLALTKVFNNIFDKSLQLEESILTPNTHYGYVMVAFKSIRNGESVNVSVSSLHYFSY